MPASPRPARPPPSRILFDWPRVNTSPPWGGHIRCQRPCTNRGSRRIARKWPPGHAPNTGRLSSQHTRKCPQGQGKAMDAGSSLGPSAPAPPAQTSVCREHGSSPHTPLQPPCPLTTGKCHATRKSEGSEGREWGRGVHPQSQRTSPTGRRQRPLSVQADPHTPERRPQTGRNPETCSSSGRP